MRRAATTRVRVAALAALVSALLLTAGALYLVRQMENQLRAGADDLAIAGARRIGDMLDAGIPPADLPPMVGVGAYEITDQQGNRLATCPALPADYRDRVFLRPDPPGVAPPTFAHTRTVLLDLVIDQRDNPPCVWIFNLDGRAETRVNESFTQSGRYIVYVATVPIPEAVRLVDAVRTFLWWAVPLTALLIGLVAWFAVGRALRPVAAIRREVAEISAHDPDRRVPVPAARDEIADLADTMNDMLARLAAGMARQRRFASDASHELRTPLASLRTQLEVLLAHPDRIDWRRTNENAVLDLERMQAVVADLMLLTRVEGLPPVREDVDLAALAGVPGPPVVVAGSPPQLQRLVRNLVDNAERHKASTVTVTVEARDGWAVLTVADDGPGVPEADRERVFERFVRLDEGRARDEGGAGLGLALVREIAQAHGGTAVVEDGARFVVRLPLT
ncbi:ATP-binding protein [Saccharothrix sp.]|uniref:sensor histidine kinase n=1 Tax=Saccharothrix sp. TaxID=1873460 RepID=UPI00281215D4|nr:ATP-binding protein [Saccharothrix sp.]